MGAFLRFAFIFPSGGLTAPNMPLRLIDLQHVAHLSIQPRVHHLQPLGHILMYGALTDLKSLGSRPHRGFVLQDVLPQLHRAFFHYTFHPHHLIRVFHYTYMYERMKI